jgi:hypothetical protein
MRFAHRLALALGMTVDELLSRISLDEFLRWQAYFAFEPFGDAWLRTAMTLAMAGNCAGGKRGGRSFRPDDFMPVKAPRGPQRRMSGKEILSIFRGLAAAGPQPVRAAGIKEKAKVKR